MAPGGLTPDQIARLLAKPDIRSRGSGKGTVDTSDRSHKTWFALASKLIDEDTNELMTCSNPSCLDPRPSARNTAVVALVNDHYMCRFCFLDGWLL